MIMSVEENGVAVGGSPLDLNNLPEDFTRDGKQPSEDTSSSGTWQVKKKNSGKNESGKVYECRFCSLKFCKSQALGGHMNRHRQERETESLNKARQLVFGNETLPPPYAPFPPHHLGGGYHHRQPGAMYPTRTFPTTAGSPPSSTYHHQPPHYSTAHPPPPPLVSYPSQYPPHPQPHDYFLSEPSNYTCLGAPVAGGFLLNSSGSTTTARGSLDTGYHRRLYH